TFGGLPSKNRRLPLNKRFLSSFLLHSLAAVSTISSTATTNVSYQATTNIQNVLQQKHQQPFNRWSKVSQICHTPWSYARPSYPGILSLTTRASPHCNLRSSGLQVGRCSKLRLQR